MTKSKNRGSAVVEATLIIPIFIFAMLAVYAMCESKLAEGIIYEASAETAEYMAEYAYVSDSGLLIPGIKFPDYVDDAKLLDRYINGGVSGVNFLGTVARDEDDFVVLRANYTITISMPFMPKLSKDKHIVIRQRAYVGEGDTAKEETAEDDIYVYITDNRDVYHSSRACTHLNLSVQNVQLGNASARGYTPCEFCGDKCGDEVFITDEGQRYHSSRSCSGLKRTIYRVRLSDLGGLRGCQRCVN